MLKQQQQRQTQCVVHIYDPSAGKGRQEDPWGLLTSQYSFLGELQANEGPCLKILKMLLVLEEQLSLASGFHMYMYMHMHTHAYTLGHVCMCICTHTHTFAMLQLSSR